MRRLIPVLLLTALAGCGGGPGPEASVPGGDATAGKRAIAAYGCGACHTIPGIAEADARVGPSLADWDGQRFIAGEIPNEPDRLIDWIRDAPSLEPGTLMPDLDVTEQEARDIAAYLYCCS